MATLKELKEMVKPFKNTFVIDCSFNMVLLLGVVDEEDDYYWVFASKTGIRYSTCVGSWTPLKGFIDERFYNEMVDVWNLNYTVKAI